MPTITDSARQWGFGEATGIIIGPEAAGTVPLVESGKGARRWFRGETMITAIGQGAVTATPLQMARFAAAIANGGDLLRPHLISGQPAEVSRHIEVKAENLDEIRRAMRDVVSSVHGTAHRAMSRLKWTSAGKTGTAQVVEEAQDDDKEMTKGKVQPRKHQDHAWFMGYAPYEAPRIAFAVFVEHGGHGGHAAAPVAAAVVRTMAEASIAEAEEIDHAMPAQAGSLGDS